jgi:hypothetical protein
MADSLIVRKGGGKAAERTSTPAINFVSSTAFTIVVNFVNTESEQVDLYYGLTTPPATKITLAAGATSSNITFSGLDEDTSYEIYSYAFVPNPLSKKIKSEIFSTIITTPLRVQYMDATGGSIVEYNLNDKRYRSHTFGSSGNFIVTQISEISTDRNRLDFIIHAGAGTGGAFPAAAWASGGGGSGGYRSTVSPSGANSAPVARPIAQIQTYPIVVGGAGGSSTVSGGGGSSAFGVGASGGGRGAGNQGRPGNYGSTGGGSGGGGGGNNTASGSGSGGQGFNGGQGSSWGSEINGGGGGGGAGSAGGTPTLINNACGADVTRGGGGVGITSNLRTGVNEVRGAGGAGGKVGTPATTDWQGIVQCNFQRLSANTGSGSIVIVRYEIAPE